MAAAGWILRRNYIQPWNLRFKDKNTLYCVIYARSLYKKPHMVVALPVDVTLCIIPVIRPM